jgi:hypothetical protein
VGRRPDDRQSRASERPGGAARRAGDRFTRRSASTCEKTPRPRGRKPSAASAYRRSSCSRAGRASVSSKKAIRWERRAWSR